MLQTVFAGLVVSYAFAPITPPELPTEIECNNTIRVPGSQLRRIRREVVLGPPVPAVGGNPGIIVITLIHPPSGKFVAVSVANLLRQLIVLLHKPGRIRSPF